MKKTRMLLALALIAALLMGSALAAGYVEASASVNVRSGPGLSYGDLGTIYEGDTLEYLDKNSIDNRGVVWYKVEYKSEAGWVSSKYCELFGEVYVYATEGQSYIRNTPSLNGKALVIMREDEVAEYMGKTSVDDRGVAWYKVDYDGVTGWVSSKYTTLGEEEVYDREVIADDGKSYIRDYPGLNGEKLDVFREGESAIYLEKSSKDSRGVTWYKIEYDGIVGWVSSRYTSVY
ncbi:MAG: SH3 domain-containing protein [Clostridia bacterium]|nr:SH3 domain-containing protein [Clostridia bacterium]